METTYLTASLPQTNWVVKDFEQPCFCFEGCTFETVIHKRRVAFVP